MSVAFLSQLVYSMIHKNQDPGDPGTRDPEEQNAHSSCSVCPSPDQWPGPHTKCSLPWPLLCSPTPGATALIPFSFIYYLALSHLNCQHELWKSHQFHCPYLRSISSHHQGFCNSLGSHCKHFTGSRSCYSCFYCFSFFRTDHISYCWADVAKASSSWAGDFTPWHRFHTDSSLGNLSLLDFLLRNISVHHLKKCITFRDKVSCNRSLDHS